MVISDEVERFALILQAYGRFHCAEIVSDMEFAAGLETGEDSHRK